MADWVHPKDRPIAPPTLHDIQMMRYADAAWVPKEDRPGPLGTPTQDAPPTTD
jgi:hypothetical protein